MAKEMQKRLFDLTRDRAPDVYGWCTPVRAARRIRVA